MRGTEPATTVATPARSPGASCRWPSCWSAAGRLPRASPATRSWPSGWPSAPFSLLYVVSEPDLTGLILPRFKPYALILVGLMLALLAAHFLLQRRFVRPGAAPGAAHPGRERRPPGGAGAVPALWRPWFDAVSEAFAAGRDYQARLEASEARLKAAAESIPDGARDLRRRGSAGLLQQPLSRAPHRQRAGDDGAGQAVADWGARGRGPGAGLSSRDGRRLPGAADRRSRAWAASTASIG